MFQFVAGIAVGLFSTQYCPWTRQMYEKHRKAAIRLLKENIEK